MLSLIKLFQIWVCSTDTAQLGFSSAAYKWAVWGAAGGQVASTGFTWACKILSQVGFLGMRIKVLQNAMYMDKKCISIIHIYLYADILGDHDQCFLLAYAFFWKSV